MDKQEIIKNLRFYRSDLAGRVGSLCVAGVFFVLPFLTIKCVKEASTTITYPKQRIVYDTEGEQISNEIIYSPTSEKSEKIVVYYPTEEKEGEYYQTKTSYDLSSFEYDNPNLYFDVDAMLYASNIEMTTDKETDPSTIYTEPTKLLEIEEKLEHLDEKVNFNKKGFISATALNFVFAWSYAVLFSTLLKFRITSKKDQEGTKLSIKVDREKIKELKEELKTLKQEEKNKVRTRKNK